MLPGMFNFAVGGIGSMLSGSIFSDYTDNPSAARDGDTTQTFGDCALKDTGSSESYLGIQPSPDASVYKVVVYGASDQGYIVAASPSVTIELRGHTARPNAGDEGTLLGSVTFLDSATTNSKEIESNDKATKWDAVWVRVINNSGGTAAFALAEVEFFEAT